MASAAASPLTEAKRICIDCRTLLRPGQACDQHHETADLGTRDGCEELRARVWGSEDARNHAKQLLKVGGSGAGFVILAKMLAYVPFWKGALVVLAGLLLLAVVWWLVTLVQRRLDARRNRLKPRGAKRVRFGKDNGLVGRVVAPASALVSAGSGSSCLAYDITLRSKRFRKSPVMLRDGATGAFEVELDDGSRVEIPAGQIRLRGPSRTLRASESAVQKQLALPQREEFELVPYDSVEEVLLRDGDRVAIHGELDREPLVSKSSAYRHSSWLYRPRTVAGIRILSVGSERGEELGDGLAHRGALGRGR